MGCHSWCVQRVFPKVSECNGKDLSLGWSRKRGEGENSLRLFLAKQGTFLLLSWTLDSTVHCGHRAVLVAALACGLRTVCLTLQFIDCSSWLTFQPRGCVCVSVDVCACMCACVCVCLSVVPVCMCSAVFPSDVSASYFTPLLKVN